MIAAINMAMREALKFPSVPCGHWDEEGDVQRLMIDLIGAWTTLAINPFWGVRKSCFFFSKRPVATAELK